MSDHQDPDYEVPYEEVEDTPQPLTAEALIDDATKIVIQSLMAENNELKLQIAEFAQKNISSRPGARILIEDDTGKIVQVMDGLVNIDVDRMQEVGDFDVVRCTYNISAEEGFEAEDHQRPRTRLFEAKPRKLTLQEMEETMKAQGENA